MNVQHAVGLLAQPADPQHVERSYILQREVTFELAGWRVAGKMISEDEGYLRFYDSLPGQRCSQLLLQAFQIDVILVVQLQMDICSARRLVDLELFNSRLPGFHAS